MKHLFFDLDHTLWDFEKNSESALRILFDQLGLESNIRSFTTFHTEYKKINAELWYLYSKGEVSKDLLRVKRFNDTLKHFKVIDTSLAEKLADGYVQLSPYQKNLFPGTLDVLASLKSDGYELHIITNGFKEIQEIKLSNTGIRDYFDVVLCSEEVGKQKPHIDVFHSAMNRAGTVAKDSVMIGDNLHTDILGAERAGITGILFDPHFEHRDGTHEWQIRKLNEIPELLPWIQKSKNTI